MERTLLTNAVSYVPSFALCVVALILFAITLVGHSLLLVKYRTWYFSTLVVGLVMERVGYISRTLSSKSDPYSIVFFVIQYFFIVVAPVSRQSFSETVFSS